VLSSLLEIGAGLAGLAFVVKWFGDNGWALPLLARLWRKVRRWIPGYRNSILLRDVLGELRPNGGNSLRDAVTRLDQGLHVNTRILHVLHWKYKRFSDVLGIATFETDVLGHWTAANATYLELTGLTLDEVLGDGWRAVVDKDELREVFREWDLCIVQGRDFHRIITYVNYRTGQHRLVSVDAYVISGHDPHDIIGWVGYVEPIMPSDDRAPQDA
jgi:PAS domain S-box-containing protein